MMSFGRWSVTTLASDQRSGRRTWMLGLSGCHPTYCSPRPAGYLIGRDFIKRYHLWERQTTELRDARLDIIKVSLWGDPSALRTLKNFHPFGSHTMSAALSLDGPLFGNTYPLQRTQNHLYRVVATV